MTDKKDIELIGEYEELVVLLRQLHKDTPILEEQHQSINKAFVNAQEKLETTIASANLSAICFCGIPFSSSISFKAAKNSPLSIPLLTVFFLAIFENSSKQNQYLF